MTHARLPIANLDRSPQLRTGDTSRAAAETVAKGVRWTVDWAHPADEAQLLELFVRAFGHEMPAAQWRWKYAGLDPLGSVVRLGGRPIAFYGGVPRDVLHLGIPVKAVQITDVMVDPAQRGILTRRGAFFRAASAFAESCVGPGRAYAFAYGFPSERHTRLGERLGLYERVDEILEASWTPSGGRYSLRYRVSVLSPDDLGLIDRLWCTMAASLGEVTVAMRDSAYVRRRYLRHPVIAYLPLMVRRRFRGTAVGLVVLRDHGENGVELIDVVAPPVSFPVLVAVACRFARSLGRTRVFSWLTPSAARTFSGSHPSLAPTGIAVPTIVWGGRPDLRKLRGRWWLMGGDTDFR